MGNNYGPGVSRVLPPQMRQWLDVIWQQGKPPCDAELNLLQDMAANWNQIIVQRETPSGWLGNGMNDKASFITSPQNSNWFRFGRQRTGEMAAVEWAVVNGWLVPVIGTLTGTPPGSPDNTDTWNVIALPPPPSNAGDFRIDFAYLEVWLARVPPNPSTLNKPAASAIWPYGNILTGMSYLPDDIQDPAIGAETTERVQLQYSIRVASGLVGLTTSPDGFDPAVVFAQGAASAVTTYNFQNMRSALGDPGLWRAGDGSPTAQTALGTVDGYSYAVGIGAVFRRNSVSWLGDPSPNLNGGFNRNVLAVNASGFTTYSTVPSTASPMTSASTSVTLSSITNIPLPFAPATPVLIQIGDELMTYTGITGTTLTGITRGVFSSRADAHVTGSTITILSGRPDGLFADQIATTDILDLRHIVNPNGFDYDALLRSNFNHLIRGNLQANWKRTGAGPQGPFVLYQDKIVNLGGGVALGVTRLDGPDDIREVFSDAAVPQPIVYYALPAGFIINPPTPPQDISVSWDLALTFNATFQSVANQFNPGDSFTIPVAQFKTGLDGSDQDQVRFINDGLVGAVTIRIDGQTSNLPSSAFTVTPTDPGPYDDLVITLNASFPIATTNQFPIATTNQIIVNTNIQYGPGRGVARRPDSLNTVCFENPSNPELLYRPTGVPQQYEPMHVGWAALRSHDRNDVFAGLIPVTAEAFADPGSKTIILNPFRIVEMPGTLLTHDGTAVNVNTPTGPVTTYTDGITNGTTTFYAPVSFPFLPGEVGDAILVTNGEQPGQYTFVTNTLSGTFHVIGGNANVTTSVSQVGIVNPGDVIQFASQAGFPYIVLTVAVSTITLTTNYGGSTATATTGYDQSFAILDRPIPSTLLTGTFNVSASATVPTSVSQVGIVHTGDTLVFASQSTVGYTVLSLTAAHIVLTAAYTGTPNAATTANDTLAYSVQAAQGLMPINDQFGNAKWGQTDPLNLFSSGNITTYNPANNANLYIQMPRSLIPAWGEYHVPILPVDQGDFAEGINYMSNSVKGGPPRTDADKNYVPYVPYISGNGGGITFQTFATNTLTGSPPPPAPYNRAFPYGGLLIGGMQQFVDTRGLGRQGLQLPPFYGIARLFAVYEYTDYTTNGSAYDPTTRLPIAGKATNLLRQNVPGPTFWVELDADSDSTFILNAVAIDISRSPIVHLASFAAGNYVIEANIFGFDRGFFDLTQEARLVLTAPAPPTTGGNTTRSQAVGVTRSGNIGVAVAGPSAVLPGPLAASDAVVINYTRTPYMGDAWGSQTNYIDIQYAPGPLLTGNAYQLASTTLNQQALTRPNQKLLEVLSSVGFATTLGTGRLVGDFSIPPSFGPSDIGYENPAQYPPTSVLEARPTTLAGDFIGDNFSLTIGSDILGLSERLPLGALFRDKDFRGESFGKLSGPFVLIDTVQGGLPGSLAGSTTRELTEWFVQSVDLSLGQPGDLLVHVDGEQGNYTLLTNYRVNRGGSVFTASGPHPGGEVASIIQTVTSPSGHTNLLVGRAFLVRNTVTDIGASEVSAGDELMMLIVTTVLRLQNESGTLAECICGTNGSYEGYSAADLYRIEGHPLLVDNTRDDLNPSTIVLAQRAF
jgi:hypothetical protein